jgi:mono/diheme cytochrome c family protein
MTRPRLKQLLVLVPAAALLTACGGSQRIELDRADRADARISEGAVLFAEKCGGCHTLEETGTHGSAIDVRNRERVDGPNFNTRREDKDAILYAIRNGGFSGAIMPENIVVGDEAEKVAEFLAKYAGRDAARSETPDTSLPGDEETDDAGPGRANER